MAIIQFIMCFFFTPSFIIIFMIIMIVYDSCRIFIIFFVSSSYLKLGKDLFVLILNLALQFRVFFVPIVTPYRLCGSVPFNFHILPLGNSQFSFLFESAHIYCFKCVFIVGNFEDANSVEAFHSVTFTFHVLKSL